MQRLTTALALAAFVVAGLTYNVALARRARRKGEHVAVRDELLALLVNATWLTLAAVVAWMMFNPGW